MATSLSAPQAAAVFALTLCAGLALAPPARAGGRFEGWPREFDAANGTFVVYAPQPERLQDGVLEARAAFSFQGRSDASPRFGVLFYSAHVDVDRDSATVIERDLDVTRVRLPGATAAEALRDEHLVEDEAQRWDLSESLAALQAGLAAAAGERLSVDGLEHTPPNIVFVTRRTLLVQFDGEPELAPVAGSRCQRVVNTPYAVVFEPRSRTWWLNGANAWYRAAEPLGPWTPDAGPPRAVAAVVPPDTLESDQLAGTPPDVVTATQPTELVVSDGEPLLEPLVGDRLFYVANSENDVLRDARTHATWVLLAGRWYTAQSPEGPWRWVAADSLPEVFARIPEDSPRGNLLASVAGTDAADAALADLEIPQTSAVTREDHDVEVEWDGPPQFVGAQGSSLQYGVNTDAQVVFEDGRYFLCDQGVWYLADRPDGPWIVSGTRPHGIDGLGPACPVYNLRYVEIYGVGTDVVYVGYLPGYLGYYPCHGAVVYGTGHRYPAWRTRARYFERPWTWGCAARYNPWLSRWSFGFSWSTGFLRVGLGWRDDAGTARHRRRGQWLGPGGFHRPLYDDDHQMLRARRERPGRRDGAVSPSNLYTREENRWRVKPPSGRAARAPVRVAPYPDDIYAGRDGYVYQRREDGQWRIRAGRGWEPAPEAGSPVQVSGGYGGTVRYRGGGASDPPSGSGSSGDAGTIRDRGRSATPQPVVAPAQPAAPAVPVPAAPPALGSRTAPLPWESGARGLDRDFRARQQAGQAPAAPKPEETRRTK